MSQPSSDYFEKDKDLVYAYFRLIKSKDIDDLLDLFTNDATIFEPFSKKGIVHGKDEIRSFLSVVILANSGMEHVIEIEEEIIDSSLLNYRMTNIKKRIIAHISYKKGGQVKSRLVFDIAHSEKDRKRKIRALKIEFL